MEHSRAIAASVVGAIIGDVAGYLFFTERGRMLRRQIEPALDEVARELNSVRSTVLKAAGMASEGWTLLNEAMAEGEQPPRYPAARQSSPF
jgi:gas vesicle protein